MIRSQTLWKVGVLLLTGAVGVAPVSAEDTMHHADMRPSSGGKTTVVHQPAGPMLQDKMSKAVEQIEREVKTKGPFQGAGAHAMQQGVLLVAEDPDKVKVTQGARCPVTAPVRTYDNHCDQCRDHRESLRGFLSGLHVCAERECGRYP